MKLIYRVALRLSLVLLPLMALWATLFYFTMVEEINDETDDALENYSELLIIRMLAGRELPPLNDGSNNSYSIRPVDKEYAEKNDHIQYYDAEVYIPEKGLMSQLAASINRVSEKLKTQNYALRKKETARANWIAGVSHDIRTPLSMVMGHASTLEEDTGLPEEALPSQMGRLELHSILWQYHSEH